MRHSPKFSSPIFTVTLKMYLAYTLTVAYLLNFSSPIALPVWFAPCPLCTVIWSNFTMWAGNGKQGIYNGSLNVFCSFVFVLRIECALVFTIVDVVF